MGPRLFTADGTVGLRKIEPDDFGPISAFPYSVSIADPHDSIQRLEQLHAGSAFWSDEAAAVALVDSTTGRMIGTLQSYRSAPCIHGLEIGYVIHAEADRGHGHAARGLRLFSDHLFATRPFFRQQLVIEVWNTASWKTAERAGFVREGVLRSAGFGRGDPADCFVYSRTAKDRAQEQASTNGPSA